MSGGFIKLHRKILDWEWYQDNNAFRLFLHLLLKANHKPKPWQGQVVNRGQIVIGRSELSAQTGMTEQQVRTALSKLKRTGEVTSKSTNKYTILTIENYDVFQSQENEVTSQLTDKQPASNQPDQAFFGSTPKNATSNQPTAAPVLQGLEGFDTKNLTNKQPTNNQQVTTNKKLKNVKNIYSREHESCPPDHPPCPYQKIIEIYHEELPELRTVVRLTEKRKTWLRARWRENQNHQQLDFWKNYFRFVRESEFLLGVKTGTGERAWQADFEWLINSSNFVKVLEGNYHA